MKRILALILAALLLCGAASALAEEYCTIAELRQQTPQRLTGSYKTPTGQIDVDAPILLPSRDKLPAFEVQCAQEINKAAIPSDVDYTTDTYSFNSFSKNYDQLYPSIPEDSFLAGYEVYYQPWSEANAENNSCTPEEIHEAFHALMRGVYGAEEGADYILEKIEATSRPWLWNANDQTIIEPLMDEGIYRLNPTPAIRGIPIVDTLQNAFALDAPKAPVIPQPYYSASYKAKDIFMITSRDAVQEKALLAEDVPLLTWAEIQAIMESLLRTGQIKSISEIRLCELVLFHTPDLQKDVFTAMPCWRITGTITDKIWGGTDGAITKCFINAQTGDVIDTYSKKSDRACANELITWDQLQ